MIRLLAFGMLWLGATLVLSGDRWARRIPLPARVQPYSPFGATPETTPTLADALRTVVQPTAVRLGDRCSRALGVEEDLDARLDCLGATTTPEQFRTHQLVWVTAAAALTSLVMALTSAGLVPAVGFTAGAGILAFLVTEQRLTAAVASHRARLAAELPVVAEQLGILLGAGYSISVALQRIAARGSGVASADLARVLTRITHGIGIEDALREWAGRARSEAVQRLVAVLVLGRHGTDLGSMISDEARAMRREAQRSLIEQIERRAQLVWIPVTVAALAPGAVLIAVPFLEAFQAFSAP